MFNNIIYIIVVLVIFNFNYPGEGLFKSPVTTALLLLLFWLSFSMYCKYRFNKLLGLSRLGSGRLIQGRLSSVYQLAVTRLSILSIVIFGLSVYLLNLKYWLLRIPGFSAFSILSGAGAIAIFFAFLATIWYHGYPVHYAFAHAPQKRRSYIASNIKLNVPILFPWAVLTACYDLITLLSWPSVQGIFESEVGQFIFFTVFLVLLVLFLPPLIKYWWGCSPLPDTEKKQGIVSFLRSAGFKYRHLLRWPLLEGRTMTAGVMGLLPRLRYILVTDSLMQALSEEELNAVMAHEVAHVKYKHMLFYVLFLLGYLALSFGIFDFFPYAVAAQPWLWHLTQGKGGFQTGIYYLLLTLPFIVSVIVYFRYVMGFFMRNFERQADLYSMRLMGSAEPTITSLEKIAYLSGQSRHQPSWHHFSIAERVELLRKAWENPQLTIRHSRRLVVFLTAFFVLILSLSYVVNSGSVKSTLEEIAWKRIENRQLSGSAGDANTYRALAAIYHERGDLGKAAWAYENILRLNPHDDVALNNLAWILATAEDRTLVDFPRALSLAKRAVEINRTPTFLDTLAEAYYVNGFYEEALRTIEEALEKASENRGYLSRQLAKFKKKAGLPGR